jgi:hypothetical protein
VANRIAISALMTTTMNLPKSAHYRMMHLSSHHGACFRQLTSRTSRCLFFFETRVVAGDVLGMLKIQTEAGSVSVGHASSQI